MNKLFLLSIVLLLSITSCKKIGKDEISGSVETDSSFCLLPGVDVELYEFHDFSISNAKFLTSATTDSNGKYILYYNLGHRNPHFLRFVKSGYYTATHTIESSDDLKKINMILNY